MARKKKEESENNGNTSDSVKEKKEEIKNSVERARIKGNQQRMGLISPARQAAQIKRASTGLKELDEIIGGGYPLGRMIQVAGADKSGKTTICYVAVASLQKQNPGKTILFIDSEGTFDPERSELFGVDLDFLDICRPESAEEAFMVIRQYLMTDCPLIVLDSIPMCFPEKVMDGDVGDIEVAPIARFLTLELPKLNPFIKRSDCILLFINQLREKIGGPPAWGDNTQLPGGRQLRHFSSIILKVGRKGGIEVSKDELGQLVKVKVEQNKTGIPKKECILNLIYTRGFVSNEELEDVKKEVRKENLANEKLKLKDIKIDVEDDEEDNGD